MLGFSSF